MGGRFKPAEDMRVSGCGSTKPDISKCVLHCGMTVHKYLQSSLKEGLFCSLRLLLGEKCSKLRAGAGVGELGGWLGGTAAVLHIEILHEQHLMKTKVWKNKEGRRCEGVLFPWLN